MLEGSKQAFSICISLGVQDASRKRTEYSLPLGPWAGTMAHTSNKEDVITVTQVKWEKMRIIVKEMETLARGDVSGPSGPLCDIYG